MAGFEISIGLWNKKKKTFEIDERDGTRKVNDSGDRVAAVYSYSLQKEMTASASRHTARIVSLVELSAENELPLTIYEDFNWNGALSTNSADEKYV